MTAPQRFEVGGKYNFSEYRSLLDALQTPSFIVADLATSVLLVALKCRRSLFSTIISNGTH